MRYSIFGGSFSGRKDLALSSSSVHSHPEAFPYLCCVTDDFLGPRLLVVLIRSMHVFKMSPLHKTRAPSADHGVRFQASFNGETSLEASYGFDLDCEIFRTDVECVIIRDS